jgi:hypothetical protein
MDERDFQRSEGRAPYPSARIQLAEPFEFSNPKPDLETDGAVLMFVVETVREFWGQNAIRSGAVIDFMV